MAGKTAFEAAIEAGHTRIRPVLMTAAAMIVGMVPMAIGGADGEGGCSRSARSSCSAEGSLLARRATIRSTGT
jgi:multidrug efflux pump subunit AcrB